MKRDSELDRAADVAYWACDPGAILSRVGSRPEGLSSTEAGERLQRHGANELGAVIRLPRLRVLFRQLRSPLLLLLVVAAAVSAFTAEWADAAIVLVIVLATVGIGYFRERGADEAVKALTARVSARSRVVRDGRTEVVASRDIVPGDVLVLSAGNVVPADALVLEATDCHVSEAVLTGESFPVRKRPGPTRADAPLARRSNCLFHGTNIQSGSARALVVRTGRHTEFGTIARRLTLRPPEAEFERGIRRFGYLLTSVMLIMVLAVVGAHALRGRPAIETLLFAIALAVGLSPELLPAILGINLARSAQTMTRGGVLVRKLDAIENLGSMDVLCTDKTGTLTEGVVSLDGAYDFAGQRSDQVLELAAINAALETGLPSALDDAVLGAHEPSLEHVTKCAEIPFDFVRKRVSVVISILGGRRLIAKGAVEHLLEVCSRLGDGSALDDGARKRLEMLHHGWTSRGIRVLAVAVADVPDREQYDRSDEHDLTFVGFLTFLDRPKEGAAAAIRDLAALGVSVKLITGDSRLVALHVAELVGLRRERVLTGAELDELHDEALWHEAERTDLFVEVDPNQKERIILSLKKMGHVVGFLGDGVNDAPAMHAADTSICAEQAVDVAREAADFVLVERNLDVIRRGIEEGRKTFANTLKYVLTTTSANLGNMLSMAVASLFLPFLPLLAGQILLNNFLSDVPAVGIAGDAVDPELVARPRRWDMRFIGRFMVEFGLLSSIFDLVTFAALFFVFRATPEQFRSGWFVESLLTELVVAFVVRTRRPLFQSRPGTLLLISTVVLVPVTLAIPYVPGASLLGFAPIPASLLAAVLAITVLYVFAAELLKRWFYRAVG